MWRKVDKGIPGENKAQELFLRSLPTQVFKFLMVCPMQRTKNSDTSVMRSKLDELIRAVSTASNTMLALEELDDEALDKLRSQFGRKMHEIEGHEATDPGSCDE